MTYEVYIGIFNREFFWEKSLTDVAHYKFP